MASKPTTRKPVPQEPVPQARKCNCCGATVYVLVITPENQPRYEHRIGEVPDHGCVATCFPGVWLCDKCEFRFKRVSRSLLSDNPTTAKHDRDYKKFLAGKAFPEIRVTHQIGDAVTNARLACPPKVKCPNCQGLGRVHKYVYGKQTMACPICAGAGWSLKMPEGVPVSKIDTP